MSDQPLDHQTSRFPQEPYPAWLRYFAAVVATTVAVLLRHLLSPVLLTFAPLATFIASVAFAAWFGGFGPGLFATFLGMGAAVLFFMDRTDNTHLWGLAINSWYSLWLFSINCILICLFSAAHRRAAQRAFQSARQAMEQEKRLDRILGHMTTGFVILDSDWRFIYINERSVEMSGTTRELLMQRTVWESFPETIGTPMEQEMRRAMRDRVPIAIEFYLNQTRAWLRVHAYPSPEGLLVFSSDISEEKRTGQAVVDLELLNKAILESALDGIISIDEQGKIGSVNPAAEKLFGYTAGEMLGQNITMLMPMPFKAEHEQSLEKFLKTGVPKIIGIGRQVVGLRKDGSMFPMDLSVSEIQVGGRRLFLGLVHDITEHKAAQEQRERLLGAEREARANAEHASQMKDQFLATLSHELRTPLSGILGWSQLLMARQASPDDLQMGLQSIHGNAKAQVRLVEDLLDMSRIVAGTMRLTVGKVDLRSVIQETLHSFLPDAKDKQVSLQSEFDDGLPEISADGARIKQMIWNLVGNSIKFTPAGGNVKVFASANGETVKIQVVDTGIGLTAEFLPYIFGRFRQADPSVTRRHGGLGLGLAIVRHLAELHGGSIVAASPGEGQGSTFTITLPIQSVQSAEIPVQVR